MRRFWSALALVACFFAARAACADPGSGKVLLYSSMQEAYLKPIKAGFETKYPGIVMEYFASDTGRVLKQIASERRAGQVKADVLLLADPIEYVLFKKEGILEKYSSPEASAIDAKFLDPEGYYAGARIVNVGIAYNSELVTPEEAPKSWNDLLDPKWKDQLVITDPALAGTAKYFITAFLLDPDYGPEYFRKLRANGCEVEYGTMATHSQLAAGGYKVGIALDYISRGLRAQGFPIQFIYPSKDLVSIASPIGIVKGSANQENARLLYDFILSKEGQAILVANNITSVRGTGAGAIAKSALSVDLDALTDNADKTLAVFDGFFGN